MSTQTQLRRDDTADIDAAIPAAGEAWVNTDTHGLRVGNGVLAGGFAVGDIPHRREVADFTALAAHKSWLIEIDAAVAKTLFLTAAATLGESWFCYVYASGAGGAVIDPDGAELVNDAATLTLAQGQSCTLVCDGAAFWAIGVSGGTGLGDVLSSVNVTVGVTSVDFANLLDATYETYVIHGSGIVLDTDDRELGVVVGTGATPTWQSTTYKWTAVAIDSSGIGASATQSSSAAEITASGNAGAGAGIGNAAGEAASLTVVVRNPASAANYKSVEWVLSFTTASGNVRTTRGTGQWQGAATAITSLRIDPEGAAEIDAGRFTLVGLRHN